MKLFELFESSQSEAKSRLAIKSSASEIEDRAAKFDKSYDDPDTMWFDSKDNLLHMVSELKSTNMIAACFNDVIKNKSDLQMFFFDKVYPYIEKAEFPKPHTPKLSDAWLKFRDDFFLSKE